MVKKLGEYKLLTLTAIVLIVGLVFAKYVGVAIGCILIVARIASSTTFQNLKSTLVNSFIDSKNRATALSTLSLLIQLPYALAALFIGKWIDQTSPNTFSFYLGVVLIGALLIQLGYYLFVKTRSLSKPQKGK
jgi:predicted MFS family arabinose efflux permease